MHIDELEGWEQYYNKAIAKSISQTTNCYEALGEAHTSLENLIQEVCKIEVTLASPASAEAKTNQE